MKKVIALVITGLICLSVFSFAAPLSGSIQIVGSTSVQPLAEELAQAFMAKNKNVKIFVQGGGSGAGIKAAVDGTANIGSCSRELEPAELQAGVVQTVIARDGIAVIVNKSNSVSNLTTEQLQKIYSGQITNWKEVGGPDQKIQVVNREAGSGTRGAFEELLLKPAKLENTGNCLVQASTGAVQETVAVTKEAIGYVSLGFLDTKAVKAVTIGGVQATDKNVLAKTYKLQRPFLLLTKTKPAGLTKTFLDWITGPQGQKIVAKDYIRIK